MLDLFGFFLICMVLGAIVGLLAGLLGIGGGLIVVPALSYLLPLAGGVSNETAMPIALATSLSSIVITSFSSSLSHFRLGNVQISAISTLLPGILLGGILGSTLADSIPSIYLTKIFSAIVFLLALQMLLSVRIIGDRELPHPLIASLIGSFIGIISSLAGIGGGSLTVPYLNYHGVEMRKAIGTSSVCGMFLALFSMMTFIFLGIKSSVALPKYSLGYVYTPALIGIVCVSIFTTSLGAKLTSRLPTKTIKQFFALFLFVISISMLIRG